MQYNKLLSIYIDIYGKREDEEKGEREWKIWLVGGINFKMTLNVKTKQEQFGGQF